MASDPESLATVTRASSAAGRRRSPGAVLRCVYPALEYRLQLGTREAVVGRIAPDDDTPALGHETVSRRHFALAWDSHNAVHIGRDMGSHNGSRIDGRDAGTLDASLPDQSVIQLGDVCLVYEAGLPDTAADQASTAVSTDAIPGEAPAVARLRSAVARAAPDPSPILLVGETGTGKEWIAREIHRLSDRRGQLVAINCSALSPQIIDSQLFGHVKGAFTGATSDQQGLFRAAGGGTLFLDEIGEMPLELQPKLLRALQEGEIQPVGSTKMVKVDVRIVAATNRELAREVEAGSFRRDLYARLSLWELPVPALRERRGDLIAWIERLHTAWMDKRPAAARDPLDLSPEAAEAILLHDWSNNLRELDRLVHELASTPGLARPITIEALPTWIRAPGSAKAEPAGTPRATPMAPSAPGRPPIPSREEFLAAFERTGGNVRAMAKEFDRDRRQIYRWIENYGLGDARSKK